MYQQLFDELAKNKPDHNVFSPSGSKRWLTCLGWYEATKDLPYKPAGAAAQKGNEIHALMELCIKNNDAPENHTDDVEFITHVGHVLDFVNRYKVLHPNTSIFTEVYIPYKNIHGQQLGGTIDVIGVDGGNELLIADLKTGVGYVPVENNPQLLNYAIAARLHLGRHESYRLAIIQPALKQIISEIVVTNDELDSFENQVNEAVQANLNGGDRVAGDHCKFCKAEAICKPRSIYALNKAGISLQEFIKDLDNE